MKAMYQSASNFVCRTLDAGASTMESAEKALGDVNHYVEQNSKANRMIITYSAKTRAAENLMKVQSRLDDDADFSDAMKAIDAEW